MAYVITSACIDVHDAACQSVCPVDCIHFEEGADRMLFIIPGECIDCAACEPVCPVTGIYAEDAVPDADREFVALAQTYQADKAAVRRRIAEIAAARKA